ncbi:hypothetical protein SLE2022_282280 [Rubroshorea leprosula]
MESCGRPNRSDIHLSAEEEAKMEEKTREYFDGIAPKRHTKPQRSDYSSKYVDALVTDDDGGDGNNNNNNNSIPEYNEFQRLEHEDPQKIVFNGTKVTEEFVETEYYKDLNCVGKQHHTTGTGFINMENSNDGCFSLEPDQATESHASSRGNPATNEWIPAAAESVAFNSDKPNRSDN